MGRPNTIHQTSGPIRVCADVRGDNGWIYCARAMTPPDPIRAYVAFGANLGERARSIRLALEQLRAHPQIQVSEVSSMLENPAVGGPPDSPAFLNGVAKVLTTLPPRELLQALLEIEHRLGRERHRKWDPRTIDLDLLLYGDRVIDEPDLKVPHPRMAEREFVLAPLAEIAPDLIVPAHRKSVRELLESLRSS
jgi:2-amino-4-hydroxy-6-hydroxymethyldihydropteridine diphosphokinase